jgi:hypothetical protein
MVADQNLSFPFPTSESFQAYARFMQVGAAKHLPASSTTLGTWIVEAYTAQKEVMVEVLHVALGQVHITTDASVWTSPNDIGLLGFVDHFVNKNGWVLVPPVEGRVGIRCGGYPIVADARLADRQQLEV